NIKSSALDPEEVYIQTQKVKLMRKVLNELNPKYRLMIELRFFEEMSYDAIAKEIGIPLGTVKAQLFRAKEILYNLLQESNSKAYTDLVKKKKKKK
ncbi:MAG: RNA polymerase sigma factor, partial [Saprospiraceae bacterium]